MIRKMVHNILNIKAAKSYVPYQDLENKQMLCGLLDQPESFVDHIRRYTNSLTTQMVFGFRTISIDDPKLKQLFEVYSALLVDNFVFSFANTSKGLRKVLRGHLDHNSGGTGPFSRAKAATRRLTSSASVCKRTAPTREGALRGPLDEC